MKTNHIMFSQMLAVLLGLALTVAAMPALAAPKAQDDIGNWIVTLENDARTLPEHAAAEAVAHAGGKLGAVYTSALKGFAVQGASRAALEQMPGVAMVEPDIKMKLAEVPTGVDRIDAELNTVANIDGVDERVDVDVAIIDTGVDTDHPDLNVYRGVNCVGGCGPDTDPSVAEDTDGHGTHVSGTVGALDNGIGVVGVAPGARIWAVKVFGDGNLSDIIAGVDYVTAHADEIEVANMSLSGFGKVDAFQTAIRNSVAAGVVYVVAAGNDSMDIYGPDGAFGRRGDVIPAAYPEVATISALADTDGKAGGLGPDIYYTNGPLYAEDDSFAPFSNFSHSVAKNNPVSSPGGAIDLILPGVFINSTVPGGGYDDTYMGTSMASPHAAGLAALEIARTGVAPTNAAGVHALRQTLIDNAKAQDSTFGLASLNDPDGNQEPLGYAGTGVSAPNQPPTADFTYAANGLAVDFADASSDADGSVASWNWDFGDGNGSTAQDPSHTYTATGTYTVTLEVTDNDGAMSTTFQSVTVEESTQPPTTGIVLSYTQEKVRGEKQVTLNWEPTDLTAYVYRNDVAQEGEYTGSFYETLGKGGGTYSYKVCEVTDTANCSNTVTITF